jgi:hypothetical protein
VVAEHNLVRSVDPAVPGQAQVLAARDTGMRVDFNPTLELDLIVHLPGQPPYPVSTRSTVSQVQLALVQPGSAVRVRVNPATPQVVHLDR